MGRRHKCPYCKATETTSKGARRTKTLGVRRIYRCKACKRRFTPKQQSGTTQAGESDQSRDSVIEPRPRAESFEPVASQGEDVPTEAEPTPPNDDEPSSTHGPAA
jgi:DNA-directed RNA polymerase subunit RPC12/RpoP